MTHVTTYT